MSPLASTFSSGGTASTQFYVANQSAFIRLAGGEVYVQAGVTNVLGSADPLYVAAPTLFSPVSVFQDPH